MAKWFQCVWTSKACFTLEMNWQRLNEIKVYHDESEADDINGWELKSLAHSLPLETKKKIRITSVNHICEPLCAHYRLACKRVRREYLYRNKKKLIGSLTLCVHNGLTPFYLASKFSWRRMDLKIDENARMPISARMLELSEVSEEKNQQTLFQVMACADKHIRCCYT